MTDTIELRVYGVPAPQGSKTAYVRGTRAVVVDGSSKTGRASHAAWRQAVATAARDYQQAHQLPLLDEPVALAVLFYLPKPKHVPKYRRWAATRPDCMKLVRSTEDALTGIILVDDARIVRVVAEKLYGDPPGAVIVVTPLGAEERRSKSA